MANLRAVSFTLTLVIALSRVRGHLFANLDTSAIQLAVLHDSAIGGAKRPESPRVWWRLSNQ